MDACSVKVADGLFLVRQAVGSTKTGGAKPKVENVNHVLVIDCSGSMGYDLPALREQVKGKLPKLLKAGDTLSIIWFSGKGQFGTLLEGEPVATLADLSAVNQAVDRWLRPVGLTGFKEPIEEVSRLMYRLGSVNKNPVSLFFMSDGCDNQWSRAEIVRAVEKAAQGLAAATVVEYGYYADRPLLTQMAEKFGGSLIFAENFSKFSPELDSAVQRPVAGKKVEVPISGDPIGGFVYTMAGDELVTYAVEGGAVSVPEGTEGVFYLSPTPIGRDDGALAINYDGGAMPSVYAAISLFATRMKPDVVLPLLKLTGDVALIDQFAGCFGKQKYSEFQEATKRAAFDPKQRLTKGYDPDRVPPDDAFTVLEFLDLLQSDERNRVLLGHPEFHYKRIGRGREDASSKLTPAEQEELQELSAKLSATKKRAEVKAIKERIDALTNKPEPLKFKETGDGSYPVRDLSFNEDRCNVSIQVKKTGVVDLTTRALAAGFGSLPAFFSTCCFRNYAVIKDGIVNVVKLPCSLTQETTQALARAVAVGRLSSTALGGSGVASQELVVDLSKLPVINRKMIKAASARELFEKTWELTKARADQKVFNSLLKEAKAGKVETGEGFKSLYGEDGAAWLKEQGITEYGGFAPKSVQAEATDFYLAKLLEVKIAGYSSLPSLNEYRKKAAAGKLTGAAGLMTPAYSAAADMREDQSEETVTAWLEERAEEATSRARRLIYDVARIKFAVIVGQTWFSEFKSIDENEMDLTLDGERLHFSVVAREVEEKI